MVRGQLVEIGTSHQYWWNILREHNWSVPSAHIRFNILCYIYFRMFDCAMGMHTYRCIHNTIIACVRIIIPHGRSESVWSCVWALLGVK